MVGVDHIRWNNDGLVPVVAQDFTSKEILMMAWANREAVELTESTGLDRKSTRLNSSHSQQSRMPSSA
mgnify:CR=1 FL=1